MTTEREHLAMEAAGMSDAELEAGVDAICQIRHLTDADIDRVLAYRKEQDIREMARFNTAAHEEMDQW